MASGFINLPLTGGGEEKVLSYPTYLDFPATGQPGFIYIDLAASEIFLWDGAAYVLQTGGITLWGTIAGTLSNQTDLQNALNTKDDKYDTAVNPSRCFVFQTDFNENDRAGLGVTANAGGGTGQIVTNDSTFGANSTENAIGVLGLITGTGVTARIAPYGAGIFIVGTNRIEVGARLCPDVLSSSNPTFTLYFGLGDNNGAGDMTNGVYFRYTHSVNGGRWEAVVADAGVRAAVDTGVAPTVNIFQELKIEVNQAGTEAKFYIDNVLTNTVTSGLPGAGDNVRYLWKIEKSAGANSATYNCDWFYIKTTRPTAR